MTRVTGDAIVVRPQNNVYTVLVIVAFVLELVAFIVLYSRASYLFGGSGLL